MNFKSSLLVLQLGALLLLALVLLATVANGVSRDDKTVEREGLEHQPGGMRKGPEGRLGRQLFGGSPFGCGGSGLGMMSGYYGSIGR